MNIIKAKYEILEQNYNNDLLANMFKHIEICGRTCYKSEDKITDNSYEKFINMLTSSNHGAMLEHGTVYLTIPVGTPVDDVQYMWKMDIVRFFYDNKYSVVKKTVVNDTVDVEIKGYGMKKQASATFYYITTNWRVIVENKDFEILKYIGMGVYIKRSDLDLKEDEYLLSDLIGYAVYDNNKLLGKVSGISFNNNVLLKIDDIFYIPFIDEFIEKVDVKTKKIMTRNGSDFKL